MRRHDVRPLLADLSKESLECSGIPASQVVDSGRDVLGDAVQPQVGAHALPALTRADLLAHQVVREKLPADQVVNGTLRVVDLLIAGVVEDFVVSSGSRLGR